MSQQEEEMLSNKASKRRKNEKESIFEWHEQSLLSIVVVVVVVCVCVNTHFLSLYNVLVLVHFPLAGCQNHDIAPSSAIQPTHINLILF